MPIPCPHFKITIVKRSQGQSAVAGAAYQSGERLFSEYDQKTKFYNKKKELVHAEVMLPSHAPPGYADRATLWNAVEAVENQWNSQLARRIVLAFPVEVPQEQYLRNEKAKAEQKLRACQHREKILERQMSELNRRERVHRLCTRAGMLESFLVCPGELTDDQVMELLKISFRQPEVVLALAKMVHDVHERSNVQNPLE